MKNIFLLLVLTGIFGFVNLPREQPKIIWSTAQLTWDDFQGKMKKSDPYDAVTLSAVSSSFSGNNTNLTFETKAVFMPKGSKKKQGKQSDKLLKHEQGHFDITEIFTRKLRQSYQNHKFKSYKTVGKDLNKIYNKNNSEWRKLQGLYDKETKHSKNEIKQIEWNSKIKVLLTELDDFKTTNFKVNISYLDQ